MTAQDKAAKLILKFMDLQEPNYNWFHKELAQQCALIAVDEILNLDLHSVGDYKCFDDPSEWYISYWEEVKHEIEQL